LNQAEELGLARFLTKDFGPRKNSKPLAGPLLHPNIHLGGGVFADPDKDQPRLDSPRRQVFDANGSLAVDLLCYGASINEIGNRHYGTVSSLSMAMTGI